jgi:hypothetical protein
LDRKFVRFRYAETNMRLELEKGKSQDFSYLVEVLDFNSTFKSKGIGKSFYFGFFFLCSDSAAELASILASIEASALSSLRSTNLILLSGHSETIDTRAHLGSMPADSELGLRRTRLGWL